MIDSGDLETLSIQELEELRELVERLLAMRREKRRHELCERWVREAEADGLEIGEILRVQQGKRPEPLYRHATDASKTWSGRGRQPKWLKEAIATGKPLASFRIAG